MGDDNATLSARGSCGIVTKNSYMGIPIFCVSINRYMGISHFYGLPLGGAVLDMWGILSYMDLYY